MKAESNNDNLIKIPSFSKIKRVKKYDIAKTEINTELDDEESYRIRHAFHESKEQKKYREERKY